MSAMAITTSVPTPAKTPLAQSSSSNVELNILVIYLQGVGLIVGDEVALVVLSAVITMFHKLSWRSD